MTAWRSSSGFWIMEAQPVTGSVKVLRLSAWREFMSMENRREEGGRRREEGENQPNRRDRISHSPEQCRF